MNAAKRIENILNKISSSNERQALKTFEKIFGVKGCFEVTNKLYVLMTQVESLAKKGVSEKLIRYLYDMFSCYNLSRDIKAEINELPNFIMVLETAATFMGSDMDKTDPADLTELADMVEQLRAKLQSSSIPEEYKTVIESFIDEIRDATTDIEYGGMEAFGPHIETAIGKYVLNHNAFAESGMAEDINALYAKITKIMDDAQIWSNSLSFIAGLLSH